MDLENNFLLKVKENFLVWNTAQRRDVLLMGSACWVNLFERVVSAWYADASCLAITHEWRYGTNYFIDQLQNGLLLMLVELHRVSPSKKN